MLLASLLTATLLSATWSIFYIYSRLFDHGRTSMERCQLVRSLAEQLAADLQGAIADPQAGPVAPAEGDASVRRFSLVGSAESLRLDVLTPSPLSVEAAFPRPDTEDTAADVLLRKVPELRTLFYEFHAPAVEPLEGELELDLAMVEPAVEELAAEEPVPVGLVRRQIDWETPLADETVPLVAGDDSSSTIDAPIIESAQTAELAAETVASPGEVPSDNLEDESRFEPVDAGLMEVPEVASLAFRYYDGRGWSSSWDSLTRKGLPMLVEATFTLAEPGEDEEPATRTTSAPISTPEVSFEEELASQSDLDDELLTDELAQDPDQPAPHVYRIIVRLPASPFASPPARVFQPSLEPPVRPAVRPQRPSAPTAPAAPRRIRPSDRWMRNQ